MQADLEDERDRLLGERDRLSSTLDDPGSSPVILVLGEIERALERIDDGTYGLCERCGEPIAAERLEALPYAVRCVGCAEPVGP